MNFFQHPGFWLNWYYPGALFRLPDSKRKRLVLTFDDGPQPGVTDRVLDILKEEQIQAIFFCLGRQVKAYPELFARIQREGHWVGNHSFSHLNGLNTALGVYIDDVSEASNWISSPFFRPPYGKMKRSQFFKLKKSYQVMLWDVLAVDYEPNRSPEQCVDTVLKYSRNGSVIVFHDSLKAADRVLGALKPSIKALKSKGFEFCLPPIPH